MWKNKQCRTLVDQQDLSAQSCSVSCSIGGFTIVELVMVLAILAILSAVTVKNYRRTVAKSVLEKAASELYLELRSLRAIAFKYDGVVRARFNTTAGQCTVWVDTSGDDKREYKKLTIYKLPPPVKLGIPPTAPSSWKFYAPSNPWKDSLCVQPDSRGEYGYGAMYLFTPALPKVLYGIGITSSMQTIELHKWDGAAWTTTPQ